MPWWTEANLWPMPTRVDGQLIRAAREKAGLTQHELARLVGVAGGERVSRWELGVTEPRPHHLVSLAKLLGLPVSGLLSVSHGAKDLRFLRLEVGLSTTELAERAGVEAVTYQRWESGVVRRLPRPEALEALARVLGTTASDVASAFAAASPQSGN